MSWTYRVIKRTVGTEDATEDRYAVYEVYDDPLGWTEDSMKPHGETLDELRNDLARMFMATMRPVMVESGGTLKEEANP